MKLLVTGASGFVGSAVVSAAVARQWPVRGSFRSTPAQFPSNAETVVVGELNAETDWSRALAGIDVVVHTAARVHVMHDRAPDPLAEFRRTNVAGTLALARQAASAGVSRFVFLSSIKVNGEETAPGRPYRSEDAPAPADPYGRSKAEAEQQLRDLAASTGMPVTIIRPVLVYGPGVKGNFLSLLRLVNRELPLPLGSIRNARSLIALDNLVDFIMLCAEHAGACNQTFLVSDCEDLSTTALLRRTAAALGKRTRLLPVPQPLIEIGCRILGKRDIAQRITCSLQVDISSARSRLGWSPRFSVDESLRKTAQHFLQQER